MAKKKGKNIKGEKCKFRCPIRHGPDQSILRVSPGIHHAQMFGASPKGPYIFGVLENLGHGKCKLVVLRPCFMKIANFWNLLPRGILQASNHTRKRTLAWPAKCVQVPKRGGKQKCKLQFVATPLINSGKQGLSTTNLFFPWPITQHDGSQNCAQDHTKQSRAAHIFKAPREPYHLQCNFQLKTGPTYIFSIFEALRKSKGPRIWDPLREGPNTSPFSSKQRLTTTNLHRSCPTTEHHCQIFFLKMMTFHKNCTFKYATYI